MRFHIIMVGSQMPVKLYGKEFQKGSLFFWNYSSFDRWRVIKCHKNVYRCYHGYKNTKSFTSPRQMLGWQIMGCLSRCSTCAAKPATRPSGSPQPSKLWPRRLSVFLSKEGHSWSFTSGMKWTWSLSQVAMKAATNMRLMISPKWGTSLHLFFLRGQNQEAMHWTNFSITRCYPPNQILEDISFI